MFINFGNCEICGNMIYASLYGLRCEILYSCNCHGESQGRRVLEGILQQKMVDGCVEYYKRIMRVLVVQ